MGIEPTSVAWEATALPLSYARIALAEFMRVRVSGAMRADRTRAGCPAPRVLLANCGLPRASEVAAEVHEQGGIACAALGRGGAETNVAL